MKSNNLVMLSGRLSDIPTKKIVDDTHEEYTQFSIDVLKDNETDKFQRIVCKAWGKSAELIDTLDPGDPFSLKGTLNTQKLDKQRRVKYYTYVYVTSVQRL